MTPRIIVPKNITNSSRRIADSAKVGIGGDQSKPCPTQQRPTPPKTLTRLIAKRNWWEIDQILSSGPADIGIDEKGVVTEEAVVQFALRYRAPLYIIKLLALRYPRCITRPDSTGKYACHVAAKYGAMPNVMEYLVCKNKFAASVQDPAGKCPIHYVGEFYASTNDNELVSIMALNDNMLQVIRILREAAPQSFNLEDSEGYNAIEYAIENDCDIKVIKTMQRTARDDWRAMKANGHGKKHEELAMDVERTAKEARVNASFGHGNGSSRAAASQDLPDQPVRSFMAKSAELMNASFGHGNGSSRAAASQDLSDQPVRSFVAKSA